MQQQGIQKKVGEPH